MTKKTTVRHSVGIDSYIEEAMSTDTGDTEQLDIITRLKLRQDTANYIHRMTADLCVMATKADLGFLAYLIDMARIEAYDRTRDKVPDKDLPENNAYTE